MTQKALATNAVINLLQFYGLDTTGRKLVADGVPGEILKKTWDALYTHGGSATKLRAISRSLGVEDPYDMIGFLRSL